MAYSKGFRMKKIELIVAHKCTAKSTVQIYPVTRSIPLETLCDKSLNSLMRDQP